MTEDMLFSEALKLPTDKRAELAAALIRSLDGDPDEDAEAAWAAEIERRVRDIKAGKGKSEDWEAVRDRALDRLRDK
jgi:putative addiction module component (TIGR02574 family)